MPSKSRDRFANVGLVETLLIGLSGLVITFVPGAQVDWFAGAAGAASLGLLSPSGQTRARAIALVVAFLVSTWLGYQDGLRHAKYLESLRQR